MKNIPISFKISGLACIIIAADNICFFFSQNFFYFILTPDKELTFLPFAVRIRSAVESTLRVCHFPEKVTQRFKSYFFKEIIFSDLVCLNINLRKECIVIEHLFKVRNKPFAVN